MQIALIDLKLYVFNGKMGQYKAIGHDNYLC